MSGTLFGLGVGPGNPELVTVKALRLLRSVPVIVYPANANGGSLAREIVAESIPPGRIELPFHMPCGIDRGPVDLAYDRVAEEIDRHLTAGRDCAVLCEGDPLFHGSFQYLMERLSGRHRVEVVPGVASPMAATAAAGLSIASRDGVLTVLPATLPDAELVRHLSSGDSAVIMKLGRHSARVRAALEATGAGSRAVYVERATLPDQRVLPLAEAPDPAPYFSLILVPPARTEVS